MAARVEGCKWTGRRLTKGAREHEGEGKAKGGYGDNEAAKAEGLRYAP